jgi:hypothetical protein
VVDFKKNSIGRFVALICATGVTAMLLWAVVGCGYRSAPQTLPVSPAVKSEQLAVPADWRMLDVKNKVTIRMPPDMQPSELIGDSFAHREAYGNREVEITISYGETVPQPLNQRKDSFDRCETPQHLLKESTYHQSVIEIDGQKAQLGINRYYQPEFILAYLCFLNPSERSEQLILSARCNDDHALETAQKIFASIRFKGK